MSVPMRWEQPVSPEPLVAPGEGMRRRRIQKRNRSLHTTLSFLWRAGICALALVGAFSLWPHSSKTADLHLVTGTNTEAKVTLQTASAVRHLGFVTVTGNALNRFNDRLPRVEAVVELLDRQNHTLQVESSLVAFDPLPPGETAPFRVEVPDSAQAVAYRVRFKQLLGASLN